MYASHQTATSHVWGMLQDHPAQSSSPGKARLQTHFELIDHKSGGNILDFGYLFLCNKVEGNNGQ